MGCRWGIRYCPSGCPSVGYSAKTSSIRLYRKGESGTSTRNWCTKFLPHLQLPRMNCRQLRNMPMKTTMWLQWIRSAAWIVVNPYRSVENVPCYHAANPIWFHQSFTNALGICFISLIKALYTSSLWKENHCDHECSKWSRHRFYSLNIYIFTIAHQPHCSTWYRTATSLLHLITRQTGLEPCYIWHRGQKLNALRKETKVPVRIITIYLPAKPAYYMLLRCCIELIKEMAMTTWTNQPNLGRTNHKTNLSPKPPKWNSAKPPWHLSILPGYNSNTVDISIWITSDYDILQDTFT